MLGAHTGAKFRAWLAQTKLSTKLKSANIFILADWGQSAKFNSRQVFGYTCMVFVILDDGNSIAVLLKPVAIYFLRL